MTFYALSNKHGAGKSNWLYKLSLFGKFINHVRISVQLSQEVVFVSIYNYWRINFSNRKQFDRVKVVILDISFR